MADKKDTKSARTKMIEEMPSNPLQRGAAKVSDFLDRMGVRQDDKYEGKTKDDVVKKAKGGMVTARGQGKVMKSKSCKMY